MKKFNTIIDWDKIRNFCQTDWETYEYWFDDIKYKNIKFDLAVIDFELGEKKIEETKYDKEIPLMMSDLLTIKCYWDMKQHTPVNIFISIPRHFVTNMDDLTLNFLLLHELGHPLLNPNKTTGLDVEVSSDQYAIDTLCIDKDKYVQMLELIDKVFDIPEVPNKNGYTIYQQRKSVREQKLAVICQINKWKV